MAGDGAGRKHSANTLRAQKRTGAIFQAYCESVGEAFLPANPHTVRAFINAQMKAGKKYRRSSATSRLIFSVPTAAHLHNPCSSEAVRLGLKKMGRETSARQDQAHPLNWKDIKEFIESAGEGLRADRTLSMLVAYGPSRRGELVTQPGHRFPSERHHDQALIRRGKTDAAGQGRVAYLSRTTVRWLKVWLEHAGVEEGEVFRRLIGRAQIGGALYSGSVALIFKRVARWIGMPARYVAAISGHSTRVGATQDLAALDIDLAAITQAGGVEITANAVAICGEDQCGKIRHGAGRGEDGEGLDYRVREAG